MKQPTKQKLMDRRRSSVLAMSCLLVGLAVLSVGCINPFGNFTNPVDPGSDTYLGTPVVATPADFALVSPEADARFGTQTPVSLRVTSVIGAQQYRFQVGLTSDPTEIETRLILDVTQTDPVLDLSETAGVTSPFVWRASVQVDGTWYPTATGFTDTRAFSVVEYTGQIGDWATLNRLPASLRQAGAARIGDYVYVVGGRSGDTILSTVYSAKIRQDGTLAAWTENTALPAARSLAGVFAYDGKLFVVGGTDGTNPVSTVYSSSPGDGGTLGAWATQTELPTTRSDVQTIVVGSTVYALGGAAGSGGDAAAIYSASLASGSISSWTEVADVGWPDRSTGNRIVTDGTTIYATGIEDEITSSSSDWEDAWGIAVSSLGTSSWTPDNSSLPGDRTRHVAILFDGDLFLLGGAEGSENSEPVYSSILRQTASRSFGSWTELSSDLPATIADAAHIVHNGRIYLFGGWSGIGDRWEVHMAEFEVNQTATPTATLSPPTVSATQSAADGTFNADGTMRVTFTGAANQVSIRYTDDGTTPSTSTGTQSTVGSTVSVAAPATIRAIAYLPGTTVSSTVSEVILTPQVAAPEFSPDADAFTTGGTITITSDTPSPIIRYRFGSQTPTSSDTLYSGPVTPTIVPTITAIATRSGWTDSEPASITYAGLKVTDIAAGWDHAVALRADGTVWAWGEGINGQLGDGASTQRTAPVRVGTLTSIASVGAGFYHSFAVGSNGTLYAWGENSSNQLGDGSSTDRASPVTIAGITNVAQASGGFYFSVARRTDGSVWSWGSDTNQALGNGGGSNSTTPAAVVGPGGSGTLTGIAEIASGYYHTLARTTGGAVYAWGDSAYYQTGAGTTSDLSTPTIVNSGGSAISGATAIGAGWYHSLVAAGGNVLGFGYNADGQLGRGGTSTSNVSSPANMVGTDGTGTLGGVSSVSAGLVHSIVLAGDDLYAAGRDTDGQLGYGSSSADQFSPVAVDNQDGSGTLSGITKVAAGAYFSLALDSDGRVWGWGDNSDGQLADGTVSDRGRPILVGGQ